MGDHRDVHGVEPICRVLSSAPATFHENLAKWEDLSQRSDRARRDGELKPEIERVFEENLSVYGVRKICITCGEKALIQRVAPLPA